MRRLDGNGEVNSTQASHGISQGNAGEALSQEYGKLSLADRARLFAATKLNHPVLINALNQALPFLPALIPG